MSAKTRIEIAYWFMLLMGMTINLTQLYRYVNNQLEYNYNELVVLVIGVVFNFAPRIILNLAERLINKKIE